MCYLKNINELNQIEIQNFIHTLNTSDLTGFILEKNSNFNLLKQNLEFTCINNQSIKQNSYLLFDLKQNFIGICFIYPNLNKELRVQIGDICYYILKEYQNKKYGNQILSKAEKILFNYQNNIKIITLASNICSIKVLKNNNYTIIEENFFDQYHDQFYLVFYKKS